MFSVLSPLMWIMDSFHSQQGARLLAYGASITLLILQPFHHFTYITARSPTLPSLYLCHSSFSKPSVASPTSQLIFQPFHRFTYVTAHSPNLPLLHLHHSSFSNPSIALPMSQLILQTFRCFTYITAHFPTLLSLLLRHRLSLMSPGELLMLLTVLVFSVLKTMPFICHKFGGCNCKSKQTMYDQSKWKVWYRDFAM